MNRTKTWIADLNMGQGSKKSDSGQGMGFVFMCGKKRRGCELDLWVGWQELEGRLDYGCRNQRERIIRRLGVGRFTVAQNLR